jgi:type IX secretion system PorP/SprF family membrane protein
MKKVVLYTCLCTALICRAQQTMIYTQYLFNKAGANPAASGIEINQKYNYTAGINRQWVGFDNAPKQNFVNVSLTLRPPRAYRLWQNVGVYADSEENGLTSNNGIYGSYTLHLLVKRKWVFSAGAFVGLRSFFVTSGVLDKMDPINGTASLRAYMYPDIIPGIRLSKKRFFLDLSARNLSITRMKDFNGNRIGGPSKLKPTLFAGVGRKIPLGESFLFIPAVAVNMSMIHIPAVDLNMMFYYNNLMGAGVALRNASFMSIIYQVRLFENLTVGLAYSYSINAMRYAAPNSFEVMLGATPSGLMDKLGGRHSVARCPTLDF